MKTQMLADELWPTITRLAKESEHGYVAVAYLGQGANKLLPLHRGDSLIVDMSRETVKGGQTNPFEADKFLKKGVKMYTCSNLHAKVYIFDKTVIIGSANASRPSRQSLIEAGLLCQDRDVLVEARGFIKSLQIEHITPAYVETCKGLYTPPKGAYGSGKRQAGKPTLHSRLWVLGVHAVEFSEEEDRLCDKEIKRASKELEDARKYEISSIRWKGRSTLTKLATEGDLVVQVAHENDKVKIYPPCRVVRITRYRSFDSSRRPRLLLHIEEPKRPHLLSWKYFESQVANAGLSNLSKDPQRLIRSPPVVRTILGLWN